jgi:hypothetical protein
MTYRVKIKGTRLAENIKAATELEAKTKYCEERGFNYRVFANKLEVEKTDRRKAR